MSLLSTNLIAEFKLTDCCPENHILSPMQARTSQVFADVIVNITRERSFSGLLLFSPEPQPPQAASESQCRRLVTTSGLKGTHPASVSDAPATVGAWCDNLPHRQVPPAVLPFEAATNHNAGCSGLKTYINSA